MVEKVDTGIDLLYDLLEKAKHEKRIQAQIIKLCNDSLKTIGKKRRKAERLKDNIIEFVREFKKIQSDDDILAFRDAFSKSLGSLSEIRSGEADLVEIKEEVEVANKNALKKAEDAFANGTGSMEEIEEILQSEKFYNTRTEFSHKLMAQLLEKDKSKMEVFFRLLNLGLEEDQIEKIKESFEECDEEVQKQVGKLNRLLAKENKFFLVLLTQVSNGINGIREAMENVDKLSRYINEGEQGLIALIGRDYREQRIEAKGKIAQWNKQLYEAEQIIENLVRTKIDQASLDLQVGTLNELKNQGKVTNLFSEEEEAIADIKTEIQGKMVAIIRLREGIRKKMNQTKREMVGKA
ncbi:MAG: hypothetical protein U9O94_05050 [Nanoarchaeota archaeon]|nr:hypothetical protein [Nanoarchaeota archaeon]